MANLLALGRWYNRIVNSIFLSDSGSDFLPNDPCGCKRKHSSSCHSRRAIHGAEILMKSYYKQPILIEDLNPLFWLAADAVLASPLAEWLDVSGNGFRFIQPTVGLRPTLGSDGYGRVGIRFNSSNAQFMESEIKLPAVFEVHACAMKISSSTDFMGVASFKTSNYLILYNSNSNNLYSAGTNNFAVVNGQPGTITPGLNIRTHIGGGIRTNQSEFLRIGADRAFSGREFDGFIYEIAGFNRILTGDERLLINQYFRMKWN